MTNGQTYTQEQVNAIAQSYLNDIARLSELKANMTLQVLNLRSLVAAKDKQIAELKKQVPEPEKESVPKS